jgi:pyruvate,water dikinase
LNRERAFSVGTKNANLGELQSILGLPVPEGFAISAWAYKHFLDANQLQTRVSKLLQDVRIRNYQDLEILSEDIREAVTRKPVPDDLAEAIFLAFDVLSARTGKSGFALRSSAVGEDTAFSFAGQYLSFLNVHREDLLDRYKQILASKFTPSAIYYLLSHSLSDLDLGMGVVCMEMVDAAASGVLYTVDPLNPDGDYLVVNSVFGLGSYLVEGKITPDVFHVSRSSGEVVSAQIRRKPVQLRLGDKKNTEAAAVLEPDQPSLDPETLALLCRYALQVEEHFGCPQDVEWALDRSGKLFLLQARPLALAEKKSEFNVPATFDSLILLKGGTPICSGLGSGPVFHLTSIADLDRVPSRAILVTTNPSPYLVAAMDKISGLVTVVGGNASHLATLARELGLPTVVGMTGADELPANRQVTLDAGKGVIYDGNHPEWVSDQPESPAAAGNTIDESVRKMIYPIVHLDVIHPSDPEFTAQNCHTLHNILRFIHQKAMEEIFTTLKRTTNKDKIGLRLKTKIPLIVNLIYLDQNYFEAKSKRWVTETEIQSRPMEALWGGILEEGWPQIPVPADLKGFIAVVGANIQEGHHPEFSENSYAFLSQEYMLLNLRMGYHFSSIEAMAALEPEKNYIRMQFKLGGAPLERRLRRIWLISELLALMGFENSPQGDFLDSLIAYQSEEGVLERLRQLGRITILTKQLDMALSSDARAQWYFEEFSRKLDLRT